MSELAAPPAQTFVETLEYRRFAEFCDACRQYRYIGLCYGPPGVGKTLSARHYARWDGLSDVDTYSLPDEELEALGTPDTVFTTPGVANTPRSIGEEISRARSLLHRIAHEPLNRQHRETFDALRREQEQARQQYLAEVDWLDPFRRSAPPDPDFATLAREHSAREKAIPDPTTLVLIDEADRLKMASLEAARDLFDRGGNIGLILIGMPGLEKRLARYPQLYSRIGFVHEFRPLSVAEVSRLLQESWAPPGVTLPPVDNEAVAAIIRVTGGNFRLLHRLLSQAERIARINDLPAITSPVVEAARQSLVIGHL